MVNAGIWQSKRLGLSLEEFNGLNMKGAPKPTPLEAGLLTAMQALDNQIAREMQRTPAETESKGVLKWAPIESRVEKVAGIVLDALGSQQIELDSLIVLSQGLIKALQLTITDLGVDGLGKVRTGYCLGAMERIEQDAYRGIQTLRDTRDLV